MAKPKKDTTQENAKSIQHTSSTTALKNLFLSPKNVRTLHLVNADADNQLKASILAVGLIHNLAVTKETVDGKDTGRFAVIAGGRRLRALEALLQEGSIAEDYMVDINIYDESMGLDVSLIENTHKSDMHPYDEFMAFKAMLEQGSTIEVVANIHGVTVTHVKRRLALANASPKILEEYKKGELELEHLMTLCLTKDHNTQESAWFNAQSWNKTARYLRQVIIQDEVQMNDKRVLFVGIDNYLARGGKLRKDLFSDGSGDTVIDVALLDAMVNERLAQEADAVEKEGWQWVEFMPDVEWDYLHQFGREHKQTRDNLTQEELAKQSALETRDAEIDALEMAHENACEEGAYETEAMQEQEYARIEGLREQYRAEAEAFENSLEEWPNGISELGVIISIDHKGKIERREGLVRGKKQKTTEVVDGESVAEKKGYSQALVNYLYAVRTEALQLEVTKHTNTALALLAHKLVLQVMPNFNYADVRLSKLTVSFEKPKTHLSIDDYDSTDIAKLKNELFDKWLNVLPASSADLLDWLLKADQATVLEILALCAGLSVSTTYEGDSEFYQKIAKHVQLDVNSYWKPTTTNFYNRLSKADMQEVLELNNTTLDADVDKLKKKELAVMVHDAVIGNDWLPSQVEVVA